MTKRWFRANRGEIRKGAIIALVTAFIVVAGTYGFLLVWYA